MTIGQRLAIWRLRWMLRIGPWTSDATILRGVENMGWRGLATGADAGDMLGSLYAVLGPAPVRALLLRQANRPRGWGVPPTDGDDR